MFYFITALIITVRLILLFRFLNKPNKPPILGLYQQRNKFYYLKFICAYFILRIRQTYLFSTYALYRRYTHTGVTVSCTREPRKSQLPTLLQVTYTGVDSRLAENHVTCINLELIKHVKGLVSSDGEEIYDGAVHVQKQDTVLEERYSLGEYPKSVDAVYFNGVSKDGTALICAIARRPKSHCDAFFNVKIAGEELLLSPSLPDTYLKQEPNEEGEYKVQGISAFNYTPMRMWKVSYDGEMKSKADDQKVVKVTAELSWSAAWSPFNFGHQMSAWSLADDMAREPWSKNYFELLKKFHQTHYEQMGFFQGTVTIDGKQHNIDMPAVRQHTFGPMRDWRNFHRYVNHFIYLENGDCMAIGTVSQPAIFSHLTTGYVCSKANQVVHAVDSSDFQLYQHGESSQILPRDYGFCFHAGNNAYYVQINVHDETTFYMGENREAKFYEQWCSVEVNGVKGWACVEWQFNNIQDKTNKK